MQRLLSRVTRCAVPQAPSMRLLTAHVPTATLALPSLLETRRHVASYPSPGVRQRRTKKKKYNFLTASRLVPVARRRESRAVIRQRDDIGIRKRQEYHQKLQRDIEEKIHYFPPYLVNFVFYPKVRNVNKRKIFTGNRVLAVRTFTRVYVHVMDQLLTKDNRKALFRLIEEGGLKAPSAAMLKPYVNPRTGHITNLGVLYSPWMRRRLGDAWLRLEEKGKDTPMRHTLTPILAYLARYHADLERVPSLQQWSDAIGPLRQDELVEFSKAHVNVHRALMHAKHEAENYGKDVVEQAVQGLTMKEESDLILYVETHAAELRESLRRSHLLSSLILFGINRLPEIRAIQTPSRVFHQEEETKWAVEHNGNYLPACPVSKRDWSVMPAEQKATYYCFKRKFERRTNTGSQLYTRFCIRDYGVSKSDGQKRFSQLSDLQQAAINFPFYYSIAPKNGGTVAYRRFYHAMCSRYGLTRGTGSNTFGNRLFEAAMRKKWNEMDADERHEYFESDAIRAAFPLLPTSSTRRRDVSDDGAEDEADADDGDDDDDEGDDHAVSEATLRGNDEDEEMATTADLAVQNAKPVRRRLVRAQSTASAGRTGGRTAAAAAAAAPRTEPVPHGNERTPLFLYAADHGGTADLNGKRKQRAMLDNDDDAAPPLSHRTVITV